MKRFVTQAELNDAIAEWLDHNTDHEQRRAVEVTQMALATPGQWEATKVVEVPDDEVPLTHDDQG